MYDKFVWQRYRAAFQDRFSQSTSTLSSMMGSVPGATEAAKQRLGMFEKTPIKDLSLRQLRDAVQNMQLYWNSLRVVETMQQPEITSVVDALFHRWAFNLPFTSWIPQLTKKTGLACWHRRAGRCT